MENDKRYILQNIEVIFDYKYTEKQIDVEYMGDRVKVYRTRKTGEKRQVSLWSDGSVVEDMIESLGMKYYRTSAKEKPDLRREILTYTYIM